jgi:uncharacterized protein
VGLNPYRFDSGPGHHLNRIIHTQIQTIDGHNLTVDLFLPEIPGSEKLDVTVYCHGFKGFKDWGFVPHIHEFLVTENRALITFNHSHNGVDKTDFDALDLFSENTIGQELRDMESIARWIQEEATETYWLHPEKIDWIGHSRGGGNVWVFSALFPQYVRKIVSWAAISDYAHLFRNIDIANWDKDGVVYIENARTHQQMPMKWMIYEEYEANKVSYGILNAANKLDKPALIIHGNIDDAVPIEHAKKLAEACKHAIFIEVPNQGHTFGASHPMTSLVEATEAFWLVLDNTLEFLDEEAEDQLVN